MRQSGVELLRTLSIFLILVIHVINLVIGVPNHVDLQHNPISSITTISFESISIVCVNVFIIISGWFGIRYTINGLLKLIFQCVFFYIVESIIELLFFDQLSIASFLRGGISSFFLGWFISAYIMLYILSPVINNYIVSHKKRECQLILIPSAIFMLTYGWLFSTTSGNFSTFNSGYSSLFLFILYYSIRYFKVFYYDNYDLKILNKNNCIKAYILITVLNVILWILFTKLNIHYLSSILFLYTSPIVILQSCCLFKIFQEIDIKSKVINWIGASSLSIMLFHFCCGGVYFKQVINYIYNEFSNISCLILILLFLTSISIVAILLDQIRIVLWKKVEMILKPLLSKFA